MRSIASGPAKTYGQLELECWCGVSGRARCRVGLDSSDAAADVHEIPSEALCERQLRQCVF